MWNSFQGALEKRVRRSTQPVKADKYILLKVAKKVLLESFGLAGQGNLEVLSVEYGKIRLKTAKSIWKSEVLLQKRGLLDKMNKELGQKEIKDIYFSN